MQELLSRSMMKDSFLSWASRIADAESPIAEAESPIADVVSIGELCSCKRLAEKFRCFVLEINSKLEQIFLLDQFFEITKGC